MVVFLKIGTFSISMWNSVFAPVQSPDWKNYSRWESQRLTTKTHTDYLLNEQKRAKSTKTRLEVLPLFLNKKHLNNACLGSQIVISLAIMDIWVRSIQDFEHTRSLELHNNGLTLKILFPSGCKIVSRSEWIQANSRFDLKRRLV